jgi:hypothetical protein
MTEWKKKGNRYYKKENGRVIKAVYDEEREEYRTVGDWSEEEFQKGDTVTDENSKQMLTEIKSELKISAGKVEEKEIAQ